MIPYPNALESETIVSLAAEVKNGWFDEELIKCIVNEVVVPHISLVPRGGRGVYIRGTPDVSRCGIAEPGCSACITLDLNFMPGNPKIIISSNTYISPAYRGLGYSKLLHKAKYLIAKYHHSDCLLAAVNYHNIPEIRSLTSTGWKQIGGLTSNLTLWRREVV
jgi:GNAT superfamily N-acetyltransferase